MAARTRGTEDAFEVAVVLTTMGYDDGRARLLGCADLFDLAENLLPLLPLFQAPTGEIPLGATPPADDDAGEPVRLSAGLLLRSLVYSAPWLIARRGVLVSRVSFGRPSPPGRSPRRSASRCSSRSS